MKVSLKRFDPILLICVFFGGASVMMFELVGSRILGPYVGTSLSVWTSLIGIMLGSMGIGYAIGGVLADQNPRRTALAKIFLTSALAVAGAAVLKDLVPQFVGMFVSQLEVKSLLISAILFAPASILMAMITPFGIKLTLQNVDHAGSESGILYAISTAGSIFGTMVAGFFLIPFLGSLKTLLVIAVLLGVMASLLFGKFGRTRQTLSRATLLGVLVLCAVQMHLLNARTLVADIDTPYSRIWVYRFKDPPTGKAVLGLATDPFTTQAAQFADGTDDLYFPYARFYRLAQLIVPNAQHALTIGGCAYTYPRDFLKHAPNADMRVVEIDPGMTQIARTYFGLKDDPRLLITHEDGRVFLNETASTFDAIFVDAFNSNMNVPFQLTTIEAVQQLSRVLTQDGVVLANMISAVDGVHGKFLQAELKTYRHVFPYVSVFSVNSLPRDKTQNIMIVASKHAIDFEKHAEDPHWQPYVSHLLTMESISQTLPVLTDDLAPTEFYARLSTP